MKLKTLTSAIAVLALGAGIASADENATLIVNGEIEMVTRTAAADHHEVLDEVRSGWTYRSSETQKLQMDDFDNPGMLGVENALEAWDIAEGSEGKSCASCHGTPEEGMAGVRAVYPKWNEAAGEVRTLEMQINDCRENRMGADKWKYDGGINTAGGRYEAKDQLSGPVVAVDFRF